jgi:hypothetical protein
MDWVDVLVCSVVDVSSVDQIYKVKMADLQGHLHTRNLVPEFLRWIRWYTTSQTFGTKMPRRGLVSHGRSGGVTSHAASLHRLLQHQSLPCSSFLLDCTSSLSSSFVASIQCLCWKSVSQVTLICDTCGVNPLESMLQHESWNESTNTRLTRPYITSQTCFHQLCVLLCVHNNM